jgi:hypothetical protein
MLKAKLLLSGVKETSNVVAPIPLLSMHVAKDREPMTLMASAECSRDSEINENMRKSEEESDEDMELGVRLGREKRIVLCGFCGGRNEFKVLSLSLCFLRMENARKARLGYT